MSYARTRLIVLAAWLLAQVAAPVAAQDGPLDGFEPFVDKAWHLDGSYQALSWGPGRRSVTAKSWSVVGDEEKEVSTGLWYWDPAAEVIRGVFAATDMPVAVFEYTTRFDGNRMVSDLRTIAPDGGTADFVETWELLEDGRFEWTLFAPLETGPQKLMGGTYERR